MRLRLTWIPVALFAVLSGGCGLAGGGADASGVPTASPVFTFERRGGNIQPFSATIAGDGQVRATGAIRIADRSRRVPETTLAALVQQFETNGFFTMPDSVRCTPVLPDTPTLSIRVASAQRTKAVSVRGSCNEAFNALFQALRNAVGAS